MLNLRETPSQSARSIGQYRNGTRVKVVRKGSPWSEVYVGTRHGYMMTRYLSFDGNYNEPVYPSYPTYPSYPSDPVYPTPTPLVELITPRPPSGLTPKAGDTVTLDAAGNANGRVNTYYDAAMSQLKGAYVAGTQAMLLQYNPKTCMIYIDGGVAYVSAIYLDF